MTTKCLRIAVVSDALFAAASLIAAHIVRYKLLPGASLPFDHGITAGVVFFGTFLFLLSMLVMNGYRRHVLLRFRRSFPIVFKSAFIWAVAFPALTLFLELLPLVSRVFILLSALFLFLFVTGGRFILQRIIRACGYTSAFRQRILFIDWTPRMARLAEAIANDPWHPYEIVGVAPGAGNRFSNPPSPSYPVLGSHEEVESLLGMGLVHIVLLSDGKSDQEEIAKLVSLCERHLVSFMRIPPSFQILLSGLQVTTISNVPVLGITELPLENPVNALIKRWVDLIGALVGLVLFSPFIIGFCILVYLESPGPVFYRQTRVGRNGRKFQIIKIRSMRLDAEKESGARWASKNDERRLRIGAFMRRWNIDELPQFWNVLKGEMSLVGPRPERPELIVDFKETIDHYNARHHVVPGVTGWAQVNGLRGDTDLSERIRYDLYYMENWSVALDLQIMLMTFFKWEGAA